LIEIKKAINNSPIRNIKINEYYYQQHSCLVLECRALNRKRPGRTWLLQERQILCQWPDLRSNLGGWAICCSIARMLKNQAGDQMRPLLSGTPPILLKGILHEEDARHAMELGISGLIVSNQGGRTLDTLPPTSAVLARIRAAVGTDYPLLVDGGIRRGTDVLKAIALAANAVLIGVRMSMDWPTRGRWASRTSFACCAMTGNRDGAVRMQDAGGGWRFHSV
jgi:hypothetical protein